MKWIAKIAELAFETGFNTGRWQLDKDRVQAWKEFQKIFSNMGARRNLRNDIRMYYYDQCVKYVKEGKSHHWIAKKLGYASNRSVTYLLKHKPHESNRSLSAGMASGVQKEGKKNRQQVRSVA